MTVAATILARAAFEIVRRSFASVGSDELKTFRIKNLSNGESLEFLKVWQERSADSDLAEVQVVVASDSAEEFPDRYRADPQRSITWYRNNIKGGLVYVETKVESDEQGLKNLFTLQDQDYLGGVFDTDDFQVADYMVRQTIPGGPLAAAPGDLVSARIQEVLQHFKAFGTPIPVRRFLLFVSKVREAAAPKGALEPKETDELVGAGLFNLGLFPDGDWRSVESKTGRRLQLNMLRAELASSFSADHDAEKLAQEAAGKVFRGPDGDELPPGEQRLWREKCVRYCGEPSAPLRSQIPYGIFQQIFEKDVKGLKLGDRVSEEIADKAMDRHNELLSLDVVDGLNHRRREDAQRLLDAPPATSGELPLKDVLSKTTYRLVERLARPASRPIRDPVLQLAKSVLAFRDRQPETVGSLRVDVRVVTGDRVTETSGLVAFLYGATFRQLIEESATADDAWGLSVDELLVTCVSPPDVMDVAVSGEDGEAGDLVQWPPLEIEYRLLDGQTGRIVDSEPIVRWRPDDVAHLALFWLSVSAADRAGPDEILHVPTDATAQEWLSSVTDRKAHLATSSIKLPPEGLQYAFVAKYVALREHLCAACSTEGLSASLLNDIFDSWAAIILEARKEAIPDGGDHSGLKAFLRLDHVEHFGDGLLMLPSHPLRLRWIAGYLEATTRLALHALEGTLELCSANSDFYLDWLESLSPHQHPALTVDSESHQFLYARGERGWSEVFVPLQTGHGGQAASEADLSMLVEITRQVHAYLRAHPYKNEGLSLALLLAQASSLPFELIRSIRQGEFESVPIRLTMIAPRASWSAIRVQIEEIEEGNRNLATGAIFPILELAFVDLAPDQAASRIVADIECDIAIIPEFLKEGVRHQEKTETPISEAGRFDPLLARPTYVHGGGGGGDISVSLRPKPSDAYLSAWSTMVVRHNRGQAIAPTSPENDDFLDLRVNFARNSQYFAALHEVSHWVVAVERHLTRQQIENLPSRPEIVTVREGVGQGGLYTLVVSSNAARQLIVGRLERKLDRIAGQRSRHQMDATIIRKMAATLYDRTRQLAPRLALQALGISRVTEEILGVAVGQRHVSRYYPPPEDALLVAWLSLDEQADWFGGLGAVRADMIRVSISREGDALALDILALESKLRGKELDRHGEQQVIATLDLFEEALAPASDNGAIDGKLWRDSVLAAIDAIDPNARWSPSSESFGLTDGTLFGDARADFREGRYVLRSCQGVFVNCSHEISGAAFEEPCADRRVKIVHCTIDAIKEMLLSGSIDVPSASAAHETGQGSMQADAFGPDQPTASPVELAPQSVPSVVKADPESEKAPPANTAPLDSSHSGKLSPDELVCRYQTVLDTFALHKIDVKRAEDGVPPAVEGPALVLYRIRPAPGVEARRIFEKADALKLALRLSEQHEIRFSIDRGHISIEVPKNDEDRYYVSATDLWGRWARPSEGLAAPLGEDILGNVVDVQFSSSNSPHLLIGGTTGSGKSEALNTLLGGVTRYYDSKELRLLLVDPKGTELTHLEGSQYLDGDIGLDDQDAISLLERAVGEMERRYALFKAVRVRSLDQYNAVKSAPDKIPWWLIVLDEYADLTSDPDSKKSIEQLLKRVAQKARASGIHLIIATQKPSGEVISTNLRSNLPAQLALRVKSSTESRVIMDEGGAEALAGRGDAFLKSENRLVRVQCAKI